MSKYLFVDDLRLKFLYPCEYPGRIKLEEGDFYMDFHCLQPKTTNIPLSYKLSECYELAEENSERYLHYIIQEWRTNTLVLYRGIAGCHFCWPGLLEGRLESEGTNDYPTFTMNNNEGTRWLPAAEKKDIAQGASVQLIDKFTLGLSDQGLTIPIGITVSIPVGKSQGPRICWLNSGEIVVRGPLESGQYNMYSITWLEKEGISYTIWPKRFPNLFLPPQRPYEPKQMEQIEKWWKSCRVWMKEWREQTSSLKI